VLPLDDLQATRELAKVNKDKTKHNNMGGTGAPFDHVTKYTDDFRPPSRTEAKAANGKSAKPKAGRSTTLPTGRLLETVSFTHHAFGVPHKLRPSEKATPPRPNLFLPTRCHAPTTAYQEQFGPSSWTNSLSKRKKKLARCSSAPAARRPAAAADTEGAGFELTSSRPRQRPASAASVVGAAHSPAKSRTSIARPHSAGFLGASSPQKSESSVASVAPSLSSLGLSRALLPPGLVFPDEDVKIRRLCYLDVGR
ncbi:unnamed protein product, partial [Polarella glacialis]